MEADDVDMATADGSCLSDLEMVHLKVKVNNKEYEDPFILANVTNEGIFRTDFLRMHGGKIEFCTNKFFLGVHPRTTRNGLDRNECY